MCTHERMVPVDNTSLDGESPIAAQAQFRGRVHYKFKDLENNRDWYIMVRLYRPEEGSDEALVRYVFGIERPTLTIKANGLDKGDEIFVVYTQYKDGAVGRQVFHSYRMAEGAGSCSLPPETQQLQIRTNWIEWMAKNRQNGWAKKSPGQRAYETWSLLFNSVKAAANGLGMSHQYLSRIKTTGELPTESKIIKNMASYIGVPLDCVNDALFN